MSALKIKDAQGNWIEVPMIKGDKGDTYELTEQDKQDIANLVEVPESFEIHICSSTEYDSTTRIPTVQNPDEKTFYLVPSEDGTSPDLFVEWAYVNNAWEMFGSASIDLSGYLTDVTVGGNSIVTDGVANIPVASGNNYGIVKINAGYGVTLNSSNALAISRAGDSSTKDGTENYKPIAPACQHRAAFYGLAKVAGHDEKNSTLALGQYTPEAKGAIQSMLGIDSLIAPTETNPFTEAHAIGDLFIINGALYRAKTAIAVGDVLDDGINVEGVDSSDVYVKNTDYADSANQKEGIIGKSPVWSGVRINNGQLFLTTPNEALIKQGTDNTRTFLINQQHIATFYGLAKASGDTTQSASSNAVGTYTDEAKASIQTMLGVPSSDDVVSDVQINGTSVVTDGIASIPVASTTGFGAVKIKEGSASGISINSEGLIYIYGAGNYYIKLGTNNYTPITPAYQHVSTFYGLAKASGDTTQNQSSNAVGTYTEEAKTAIRTMLGLEDVYEDYSSALTALGVI